MTRIEYELILPSFQDYAKRRVVKLLIETGIAEYPYYISGSGGYFFYKNKHFL